MVEHGEPRPGTLRAAVHRSRWMAVPPPALFVIPLVAGVVLRRAWDVPLAPGRMAQAAFILGTVLLAAAAPLLLTAPLLFLRRRTTIIPHRESSQLITSGPYRFTRNPMYVGFVLVYLGATVIANTPWSLLFLPLPVWVMHTRVIPYEEANLTRVFGDAYRTYAARVGRWL